MEWIRFLSTFLIKNEWNAENAAASLSFASVVARTTDTQCLNPLLFAAQIQIPISYKYLGFGCGGLVFCMNNFD